MSSYNPGTISSIVWAKGINKIKKAFPKLPIEWYQILEEATDEEQFSNQRFEDAVWNLIKTCTYPEPTIANILSYDRPIKDFTKND